MVTTQIKGSIAHHGGGGGGERFKMSQDLLPAPNQGETVRLRTEG